MRLIESANLLAERKGAGVLVTLLCPRVSDVEVPGLRGDLLNLAAANPRIAIDLRDVLLLTSSGLGMLIQVRAACESGKGRVVLCGVCQDVIELLRVTRLDRLFPIAENAEAGLRLLA